ncbi:MAG: hypothetical protein HZY75_13135 [Nocardioidaceae bacterium]|nr:MAG: hypothetical protein HZY75_13135 [Nocardioidaceae bacterium]
MTAPDRESVASPAYEYGRILGAMKAGFEQMLQQIGAGFNAAYRQGTSRPLSLEERERLSEARYRARIRAEREAGRRCAMSWRKRGLIAFGCAGLTWSAVVTLTAELMLMRILTLIFVIVLAFALGDECAP